MDFLEIARARQSCRSYDEARPVEQEKLDAVLEAARLAPSACNAQPYHFTVCRGQAAKAVVAGVTGMGMNKFAAQAPVLIVISERSYNKNRRSWLQSHEGRLPLHRHRHCRRLSHRRGRRPGTFHLYHRLAGRR